jgi:two-component system KDP operon response regulator KdpE
MSDASPLVLIIDDDQQIRRFLRAGFSLEHFKVVEQETAEAGLRSATLLPVDLIVVDLNLPDLDGANIVERIRTWSTVPIIVLSVRASDEDKVKLLECGADDYVTKPFGMDELLARMRAALRHQLQLHGERPVFRVGDLSVDLVRRIVKVHEKDVRLSPKEYDLLRVLVQHAGKVLTHKFLLGELWNELVDAQYLRVYVRQLRQKIEDDPERPQYVLTETGIGYRLRAPD